MARLTNEFAWSKTRDAVFLECPRQYWFQYYGAWEGWEAAADRRTRRLYVLKQLVTREMWVGQRVHSAIERSLKNLAASTRPLAVDVDRIVALTIDRMRQDFKSSRSGHYRMHPKTCALLEHEYRMPVTDEEWRRAADTAERCLRHFYTSETFATIAASDRRSWLECEEFSSFRLGDVKVHVVLDFAMRDGAGLVVYDWKTGAGDDSDNRMQMSCYALYAREKWRCQPEAARLLEFNLNRDETLVHHVTEADLDRTRAYIEGSIADMRRLLQDPRRNIAVEADYRRVRDGRACARCRFRVVCEEEAGDTGCADGN